MEVNDSNHPDARLFWACADGRVDAVREMLATRLVDSEVNESACLREAAAAGHAEDALLLDGRSDQAVLDACLRNAVFAGHSELVARLLQDGRANPAAWNSACLTEASAAGVAEIVELLLRDGRACPKMLDSACLVAVCNLGRVDVVSLLLSDGRADFNAVRRAAVVLTNDVATLTKDAEDAVDAYNKGYWRVHHAKCPFPHLRP